MQLLQEYLPTELTIWLFHYFTLFFVLLLISSNMFHLNLLKALVKMIGLFKISGNFSESQRLLLKWIKSNSQIMTSLSLKSNYIHEAVYFWNLYWYQRACAGFDNYHKITVRNLGVRNFGVRDVREEIPNCIYQASCLLPSDFLNIFFKVCSYLIELKGC